MFIDFKQKCIFFLIDDSHIVFSVFLKNRLFLWTDALKILVRAYTHKNLGRRILNAFRIDWKNVAIGHLGATLSALDIVIYLNLTVA